MSPLLHLLSRLHPNMLLLLLILALLSPMSIAQSGFGPDINVQQVDIDYKAEETSLNDTSDYETSEDILGDVEAHPDVNYNIENVKASIDNQDVTLEWETVDAADEYVIYSEYLASSDEDEDDLSASNMERNVRSVNKTSNNYFSLTQAPCQKARYGVSVVINGDYGSELFWSNPVTTDLDRDTPFKATNLNFDMRNFVDSINEEKHEINDTEEIIITWDHGECIKRYEVKMCMVDHRIEGFTTHICDTEDVDVTDSVEVRYTTMMEPCTTHWMEVTPILPASREVEAGSGDSDSGSADSDSGSGDSGSGSGDFMGSGEIISTIEIEGEEAHDVLDSGYMIVGNDDVEESGDGTRSGVARVSEVGDARVSEVSAEYIWTAGSEKVEFFTSGINCTLEPSRLVSSAGHMLPYLYSIISAVSIIFIPCLI